MFSAEEAGLFHGHRVTSEYHFRRSYLKANKVSKSEGTRKVEHAYHFRKCDDAVYPTLSKLVGVYSKYSLPKLARFLIQCIIMVLSIVDIFTDTVNFKY